MFRLERFGPQRNCQINIDWIVKVTVCLFQKKLSGKLIMQPSQRRDDLVRRL
jgi:hypothetical protein